MDPDARQALRENAFASGAMVFALVALGVLWGKTGVRFEATEARQEQRQAASDSAHIARYNAQEKRIQAMEVEHQQVKAALQQALDDTITTMAEFRQNEARRVEEYKRLRAALKDQ